MTLARRNPNWLPFPKGAKSLSPREVGKDFFSTGEVTRYLPHLGTGKVKIKDESEVDFSLHEAEIIPFDGKSRIAVGGKVGYDVSRTPKGLKIIKIKVY